MQDPAATPGISGLSAFPITPSDADGRVDADGLRRLPAPLAAAGVDSIGLLGSTGTYAYLTREARRRAVAIATEAVDGCAPPRRHRRPADRRRDSPGAGRAGGRHQAGLLAPVSYTPLTDAEVEAHCAAVAGEGDLPVVIYDNPATTHSRLTPDLIGRIARLPGIVAAKCSAPEPAAATGVATLRAAVPAGFPIGFSGDWNATEALVARGAARFSVAAGLFPRACLAIGRAAEAGDTARPRPERRARTAPGAVQGAFQPAGRPRPGRSHGPVPGRAAAADPTPPARDPRRHRRVRRLPAPLLRSRAGQTARGAGSSTAITRASSAPRFRICPLAAITA